MAAQPDISQILASLAGPRPGAPPQPYSGPPPGASATPMHAHYALQSPPPPMSAAPGLAPHPGMPMPPQGLQHQPSHPMSYPPQPLHSGMINFQDVKPVNSGSMSLGGPGGMPAHAYQAGYPVPAQGSYRRSSRSRSRSPRRSPDRYGRHDRRAENRYASPVNGRDFNSGTNFSPLAARRVPGAGGDSGEQTSETIMIESNAVGLVIGRQGDNMRRLEGTTRTRIQFAPASESKGNPMRRCTITGSATSIEHAVREINRIIDENEKGGARFGRTGQSGRSDEPRAGGRTGQPSGTKDDPAMTIFVPSKTVGLVIGKGGESIKTLQDQSQAHINITPESSNTPDGLRPVHLHGSPAQAAMARELIMNIVNNDAKVSGGNTMPLGYSGVGGPDAGARGVSVGAGGTSESIQIPSAAVGKVIGKGGETVREMQELSGCKINVSQPSGRDIERQIELVGSVQAVQMATRLILDKVREVQSKTDAPVSSYAAPASTAYPAAYSYPATDATPAATASAAEPPGGHEAYAAYGGYENYVRLWYASQQQQVTQPQP